jgi:hypothetical protein
MLNKKEWRIEKENKEGSRRVPFIQEGIYLSCRRGEPL